MFKNPEDTMKGKFQYHPSLLFVCSSLKCNKVVKCNKYLEQKIKRQARFSWKYLHWPLPSDLVPYLWHIHFSPSSLFISLSRSLSRSLSLSVALSLLLSLYLNLSLTHTFLSLSLHLFLPVSQFDGGSFGFLGIQQQPLSRTLIHTHTHTYRLTQHLSEC